MELASASKTFVKKMQKPPAKVLRVVGDGVPCTGEFLLLVLMMRNVG